MPPEVINKLTLKRASNNTVIVEYSYIQYTRVVDPGEGSTLWNETNSWFLITSKSDRSVRVDRNKKLFKELSQFIF